MTTRPSVDQARAYADALVAWAEGKSVQWRLRGGDPRWVDVAYYPAAFPSFADDFEMRIAPTPPKLRVIEVPNFHQCHVGSGCFYAYHDGESPNQPLVKFREVSETADAELAELRRYRTEMRKVLDRWYSSNNPTSQSLYSMLCEKEIHG